MIGEDFLKQYKISYESKNKNKYVYNFLLVIGRNNL